MSPRRRHPCTQVARNWAVAALIWYLTIVFLALFYF